MSPRSRTTLLVVLSIALLPQGVSIVATAGSDPSLACETDQALDLRARCEAVAEHDATLVALGLAIDDGDLVVIPWVRSDALPLPVQLNTAIHTSVVTEQRETACSDHTPHAAGSASTLRLAEVDTNGIGATQAASAACAREPRAAYAAPAASGAPARFHAPRAIPTLEREATADSLSAYTAWRHREPPTLSERPGAGLPPAPEVEAEADPRVDAPSSPPAAPEAPSQTPATPSGDATPRDFTSPGEVVLGRIPEATLDQRGEVPVAYDTDAETVSLEGPSNEPALESRAALESEDASVRARARTISTSDLVNAAARGDAPRSAPAPSAMRTIPTAMPSTAGAEIAPASPAPSPTAGSPETSEKGTASNDPAFSTIASAPAPRARSTQGAMTLALAGAFLAGLAALAVALYSRLTRRAVSEQETRERILGHLTASPGATAAALARAVDAHDTTIRYHLRVLAREQIVVERASKGRLHYFLPGQEEARNVEAIASRFAAPAQRLIEAATATPGLTVREAVAATGADRVTIHYHVKNLAAAGVLRVEKDGRALRIFPGSA